MPGRSVGIKMLNSDYRDILQIFIEEKVKFIIVGAYALGVHGVPRATGDIDIFVKMPPKMFDRIAIKNLLQEELGKEVDIVREHKHIDSLLMEMIQKDIIYV